MMRLLSTAIMLTALRSAHGWRGQTRGIVSSRTLYGRNHLGSASQFSLASWNAKYSKKSYTPVSPQKPIDDGIGSTPLLEKWVSVGVPASLAQERPAFLIVSFDDTPVVKALGARYNGDLRRWYIPFGGSIDRFRRWLPLVSLEVPYSDSPSVKALGAKFCGVRRHWVIMPEHNPAVFQQWLPSTFQSSDNLLPPAEELKKRSVAAIGDPSAWDWPIGVPPTMDGLLVWRSEWLAHQSNVDQETDVSENLRSAINDVKVRSVKQSDLSGWQAASVQNISSNSTISVESDRWLRGKDVRTHGLGSDALWEANPSQANPSGSLSSANLEAENCAGGVVVEHIITVRFDEKNKRIATPTPETASDYMVIMDVDTSGLPSSEGFGMPSFTDLDAFETARVVRIAALLCRKSDLAIVRRTSFIVRSDPPIDIVNSDFHGVTTDIAQSRGVSINNGWEVLTNQFWNVADTVMSHNVGFDMAVLRSEVHRAKLDDSPLTGMAVACSMERATSILRLPSMNKAPFKKPSLAELVSHTTQNNLPRNMTAESNVSYLYRALLHMPQLWSDL